MTSKPSYEELERRIQELENATSEHHLVEDRLKKIFDNTQDAIFIHDLQGKILDVNDKMCRMYGLTKEEALKVSIEDVSSSRMSMKVLLDKWQKALNGEKLLFEWEARRPKDETVFNVEVSIQMISFHDKENIIANVRDITERKKAEEQLIKSEEQFRNLYDDAPVGYFEYDLRGKITRVNRTELKMLGYTAEEMIGQPCWKFIVDEAAREQILAKLAGVGPLAVGLERTYRRKDGTTLPVLFEDRLLLDEDGHIKGIRTAIQDITERKRMEEALRESEKRHRLLFEEALNPILLVDENGRYIDANEAALQFMECDREKLMGRSVWEFAPPGTVERQKQEHSPFADRRTLETDYLIHGRVKTLLLNVIPMEVGERTVLWGIGQDITERKRAEEALRESEETHRVLVEGLPDIIMRFDSDGRHLFVSDNIREVVDIEAAQFIGKTHAELGFPEAQCRFWERSIRRVFDSGAPFETEFTVGDKTAVTFNWRLIPERYEQGAVSSVLSISRDITAHRKTEQEYTALFREMLDGFALHEIICDEDGEPVNYRFLAVNPAFERMTGLEAENIVGRTVLEVLPETEKHWIKTYGKVALSGEPVFFEDHSAELGKHFEVTAFRPFAGQFTCIFHDITERKLAEKERERLQAQLNQAMKMESVGRMAGGVAHDFNNMLGVILGHTEMALDEIDPSAPLYANLQAVQQAAERSAALTRQLLAFARKQTIAPKVIDLNKTVEGMLKMLRRLIGEDIDLIWLPGRNLCPVKIDPAQIDQILVNLCVNARDAFDGKGKIIIETDTKILDDVYCADHLGFLPGEYVLLEVSDNGCGMDKKTLDQIFEPFFTTKEQGKGTGLGLASVFGMVKQNNGFINVYSEPGQGTTFKIYLPAYAVKSDGMVEKTPNLPAEQGNETILLVEDETAILEMTTMMLARLGYTVVAAATPGEAIRLAHEYQGRIDLLMTDVVMPEMNGRELAGNLLSHYPDLKRLFMSGYTANVIAHHGVLDQGVHFIQKPFSKTDLGKKLREALED